MRIAHRFVAVIYMLGVVACGPSNTTTVSTPGGTVTSAKSENGTTATITSPDGATTISTGPNAKANLPDVMPLYPGATVTSSIAGANNGQKMLSVSFTTRASPAEVIAFYKGRASALGLSETLNASQSGVTTFMASKDQMSVIAIASASSGGAEVQITWASPAGG